MHVGATIWYHSCTFLHSITILWYQSDNTNGVADGNCFNILTDALKLRYDF